MTQAQSERLIETWRRQGLAEPLVLRRGRGSAALWWSLDVFALLFGGVCMWIYWFFCHWLAVHSVPPLLGSVEAGLWFTLVCGVLIGMIGLFLIAYGAVSLSVMWRERRHGVIRLDRDGFSSPCYFNAPIRWDEVRYALSVVDNVLPFIQVAFPFIVVADRKAVTARVARADRFGAMVYAAYSAYHARSKNSRLRQAMKENPGCLVTSILVDPAGLTSAELVEIIRGSSTHAGRVAEPAEAAS